MPKDPLTSVGVLRDYTDAAAFDAHLSSDHFKAFDARVAQMVASKSVATYAQVTS